MVSYIKPAKYKGVLIMSQSYYISACSTVDLTNDYMKERNIPYVSFQYFLDEVPHKDDMGESMSLREFYDSMREGSMTSTSQVSIQAYTEHFEKMLMEGKDVLHMTLSSGISGSINSALVAAEELREKYPERKLYVEDSFAASSGYGLLMDELADRRDAGATIDELHEWVLENRLKCNHWFFTTDLTYLVRGGRVSKTSGAIGNLLNICPLLNVDYMGRLIAREKIRGKKKVIRRTLEMMKEKARDGLDYSGKVFICNSDCYEDAKELADMIEETFPKMDGSVQIFNIGTVIGSHTGPGTVALFFWGDERVD